MKRVLRLGTRGSTLARRQSTLVAEALRAIGCEVELVTIVTSGDVREPDTAWGEGAFVGALEAALLEESIDLAVHSAKDVPIGADGDRIRRLVSGHGSPDVVREGGGAGGSHGSALPGADDGAAVRRDVRAPARGRARAVRRVLWAIDGTSGRWRRRRRRSAVVAF